MHERSFLLSSLSFKILILSMGVAVLPSQAFAGFQWVAPEESSSPSASTTAPSAASSYEAPVVISGTKQETVTRAPVSPQQPVIISGSEETEATKTAAPSMAPAPVAPQEDYVLTAPSGPAPKAAPAPVPEVPAVPEKPVRGFANNVPLAVALRQILPPEYGFSVDQDVNMGTLVSWKGGKSWHETLSDMLQASGLSMHEQGKMVSIGKGASSAAPASSAPSAQPSGGHFLQAPPSAKASDATAPMPLQAPASNVGPTVHTLVPPPSAVAAPVSGMAMNDPDTSRLELVQTWEANNSETLRKVLERWGQRINVDVNWQAEYDYPVQVPATITGTFEEAVRTILKGFEEAHPQPYAALYKNPSSGQPVLVVRARGNNYGE